MFYNDRLLKDKRVVQQVITSGTTSDNEWYNEWQRMTTSDNEWQGMITSGTTSYNEW